MQSAKGSGEPSVDSLDASTVHVTSAGEWTSGATGPVIGESRTITHRPARDTHDVARGTLDLQLHGERGTLVRHEQTLTFNARSNSSARARS